jgi:hypothetical protein
MTSKDPPSRYGFFLYRHQCAGRDVAHGGVDGAFEFRGIGFRVDVAEGRSAVSAQVGFTPAVCIRWRDFLPSP